MDGEDVSTGKMGEVGHEVEHALFEGVVDLDGALENTLPTEIDMFLVRCQGMGQAQLNRLLYVRRYFEGPHDVGHEEPVLGVRSVRVRTVHGG